MKQEPEKKQPPPLGLTWGENHNREQGRVHIEWHAPCGCAFHPVPFPHAHPCSNEHKRPDLHALTEETEAFTAYNQAIEDALAAIREESQGGGCWAATFINAIARKCSPHVYVSSLSPVSPSPAPEQDDATLDRIRALLARYTQPCADKCVHSQCPLLRELHALAISDTLERAKLTVKPIVDRERAGEFVGDLMNLRLRSNSAPADHEQLALDIVEGCSNWHDIQYRIVPRIIALLDRAAPPSTQPSARVAAAVVEQAAKEVVNELLNVPRFIRNPESTIIEIENAVAAIISRHFSVQPVEEQSCWHCGVVLAGVVKPRCEDCPDECDTEGCDAMGCRAAATADNDGERVVEVAHVIPVGHSYSVAIGTKGAGVGVRMFNTIMDATEFCKAINTNVSAALRTDSVGEEGK